MVFRLPEYHSGLQKVGENSGWERNGAGEVFNKGIYPYGFFPGSIRPSQMNKMMSFEPETR